MILEEKSDKVEKFVCMHNGVDDDSVVVAICTLFVKGKRLLEMISPISDALGNSLCKSNLPRTNLENW